MQLNPQARFEAFLREYRSALGTPTYIEKIKQLTVSGSRSLIVDFNNLVAFDPELARMTLENPDRCLPAANRALKEILEEMDSEYLDKVERVYVRFSNFPEKYYVPLRKLRAEHIGKLIVVNGILVRATEVKPRLTEAIFRCRRCGELMSIPQEERVLVTPVECTNLNCRRKGPFDLVVEESTFIDWQKIRMQEKPEDLPPGQLPRGIDAILTDDIVDVARPGDRVTLIGILRPVPESLVGKRAKLVTFNTILEINNIEVVGTEAEKLEISEEDEQKIKQLSQDPYVTQKIIRSIAPSIYGYEQIKEAIALLLFGGVPKEMPDKHRIRGDINVLLLGDPGVGKSQILQYVARIAPRGLYTSGRGATAAGLTAAVMKDPDSGTMLLEAGALVLADQGVACIDEMDKMREQDRVALHEAMESGMLSIAKGGIVATLNARTSILAAANPALGRYNPYRPPSENFSLPPTILSRFDLIFVMIDKPAREHDEKMADHILHLHREYSSEEPPPIPPDLLRKYIAYARKNIRPRLLPDAVEKLRAFYLEMRSKGEQPDAPVPITARQLEALVRLAEARAKMALRNEVTAEDAEAVIRLMKASLQQIGRDIESGLFDIDTIYLGSPKSQRDKMQVILDIISGLEAELGGPVPVERIISEAAAENIDRKFVEKALNRFLSDGLLFEPKQGYVKHA
ncbi:MAG: minichromosome maintenance protein MCM [Candidatus Freyarchaeota archaeon]|nr:minichromosome maintenance protein MCM [Candidatus Jordarchaeia archaeon]